VIAAAETAADYAMTIESEAPADDGRPPDPEAMDTFELQKRMATVLPKGWKMSQTKAEQPTTTYNGFVDKKLAEAVALPADALHDRRARQLAAPTSRPATSTARSTPRPSRSSGISSAGS
jgi:hypothetical protein